MPQQPSLPYYPASITIPRQLVRWDDVNAQNGPLRRARLYLPFPSFSVTGFFWNGVADIVSAWNFECQNNFTLPVIVDAAPTITPTLITITVGQAVVDNRVVIGAEGNVNTGIN